jgi:hypothetical protein
VQTFLPYADFQQSASILDNKRLGKQRVEVLQLLRGSWSNHPASKMWFGYSNALAEYGLIICEAWIYRGYGDTCWHKIKEYYDPSIREYPKWLGLKEFHLSHQSNLLRKDFKYYSIFFRDVPSNLPYYWPV